MFDNGEDDYFNLDALLDLGLQKLAATPVEEIAPPPPGAAPPAAPGMPPGAPPVDPATGMPMDPAMMGGAPPVDPATGMPMDPAMMGGELPMPPEEDPLITLLENMARDVAQTKSLVATLVDQLGVKVPINDILKAGENPLEASLGGATGEKKAVYSDGYAAPMPSGALVASHEEQDIQPINAYSHDANRTIQAVALWSKLRGQ